MQKTTTSYTAQSLASNRKPIQGVFVSWDRQSSLGSFFTIGVSRIGLGDVIKGEGNNPAEADTYLYSDESDRVLTVEWDRQFTEPVYSVAKGLADIVLDNTDDRFTPGHDAAIGAYIQPQRPVKISAGFDYGTKELIQTFVGQIADYPLTDQAQKTVTLHVIDFAQILWDFPVAQTQLYTNKRTDELLIILLQQFGLDSTKYAIDQGTLTIPYAFFGAGDKMGDIISKLAEAENGNFFVDEKGIFRFEARIRWLDAPHTNRKNIRVQITAYTNGDAKWSTPLATVPDVNYTATYYFRDRYRSNVSSFLVAAFTDNAGAITYNTFHSAIPASTDWSQINEVLYVPAHTVQVRVMHGINSVGYLDTDDFWFTLTQDSVLNNLIFNPSVELGQGPVNPDGWGSGGYGTNTPVYTWVDRGTSDISIELTDDYVFQEEQYSFDTIVNSVEVYAKPRQPVASDQLIFSLAATDARLIPAGTYTEFFANYNDPVVSVNTPTADGSGSGFHATQNSDGTGTNRTSDCSVILFTNFSQATKVQVQNNGATDLYLTRFDIFGRPVPVVRQIYVKKYDVSSIALYGDHPVVITNDYIQSDAAAGQIAWKLLQDRKNPASYLRVSCQGLPQLQLGDRVRRNGKDYFVMRDKMKFTAADGMVQELTLVNRSVYY